MSEEVKAAAAAPASGGGKLVPVLLVMNTLLMGGVLMMVMKKPAAAPVVPAAAQAPTAGEAAPGAKPEPEKPGHTIRLESFIIQLKSVDAERYVRVAFDLELGAQADEDHVKARLAQIRDAVISYFSDRTLDELRGSEGMSRIKQALLKLIDERVPGRRVKAVYVTDFIVQ